MARILVGFISFLILVSSLRAYAFMGLSAQRMGHGAATKILTLLAGTFNIGSLDGPGTYGRLNVPAGIGIDSSNNLYVADTGNNLIRTISTSGAMTTLAGSHNVIYSALVNGTGAAAQFYGPAGVVWNSSLNAFLVADGYDNVIRKVTSAGVVTTFAGSGASGSANGTGAAATFYDPYGLAVDSSGNTYVADANNNLIRKITTAGVVTTFAGSGTAALTNGTGTAAAFNFPTGVVIDSTGTNMYVSDTGNTVIRKIVIATAVVSTFAGSTTAGSTNGTGTAAKFNYPNGLAIDSANNLYIADTDNNMIRAITTPGAVVTTLAGSTTAGTADGTGTAAQFYQPEALVCDSLGNLYVADTNNSTVRKIVISSKVVTTYSGTAGPIGGSDGTGAAATFGYLFGITTDTSGNIYVSDTNNATIRKITSSGVSTTLAGSVFNPGFANGTTTAAQFNTPEGIVYDSVSGNLFVADAANLRIRKVTTAGVVTTYAGAGTSGSANGSLTAATFGPVGGLAVDSSGNLYVADTYNCTIRKITTSAVSTLAGNTGTCAFVNGTGTAAEFNTPRGVAVDSSGNVFVADTANNVIRKITSAGVTTTFAGSTSGTVGFTDGTTTSARFNNPLGLIIDASNNIYVADAGNNAIRKITSAGVVTTVVGNGAGINLAQGLPAGVAFPYDVALYSGKLYIALMGGVGYVLAP